MTFYRALRTSLLLLPTLGGCASIDPRPDYLRVTDSVAASSGIASFDRPNELADIQSRADGLLKDGLTADESIELCLLQNPLVLAAYLRVGIARADVVQAGLFQNPGLSLALRLPDGGGLGNFQLSIAQGIADLWLIPIRKRAAVGVLERETLEVARAVGTLALDSRAAYFAALATDRELEIASENQRVAKQLVDVARNRQSAGVGSEFDVNLARAELMQTEVSLRNTTLAAFEARRRLAVLLGLTSSPERLALRDQLPDAPNLKLSDDALMQAAESSRLDLVATNFAVSAAAARLEQERRSVISAVEVGLSYETFERGRRGDRPWLADTLWASAEAGRLAVPSLRPREDLPFDTVLGPTLTFELPIFDQNQAQIARAEFLHQSILADQSALRLAVVQETRSARRRAETAWGLATYYRDEFLPLLQTNLELSREAYRGGKLTVLGVLEAQKSLLAARARHIAAMRDGAVATIELEKAVGLPLARIRALEATTATN
ncbi:MAG: TolC family protein [Phycisphaerae bacterium]|nr:TolC family protein [Phycisphaerae bacterium]